jgi:hypothetical protein
MEHWVDIVVSPSQPGLEVVGDLELIVHPPWSRFGVAVCVNAAVDEFDVVASALAEMPGGQPVADRSQEWFFHIDAAPEHVFKRGVRRYRIRLQGIDSVEEMGRACPRFRFTVDD